MWFSGGHYNHLTSFQAGRFAGDNNFDLTIEDMNQGVKWCGMFTQALPFIKSKKGHGSV